MLYSEPVTHCHLKVEMKSTKESIISQILNNTYRCLTCAELRQFVQILKHSVCASLLKPLTWASILPIKQSVSVIGQGRYSFFFALRYPVTLYICARYLL